MAQLAPFQFSWGDYPARHFHPLAKLASLLALCLATAHANLAGLLLLGTAGAVGLAASGAFRPRMREGLKALAHNARFLVPLGVFVAAFRVVAPGDGRLFAWSELGATAIYLARLAAVFVFAEAYFRSTSAEELAAAASRSARRILRRGDVDPGLYLSLALSFIPRCFATYERAHEAALARGYGGKSGRGAMLRAAIALLECFIANCLRGALLSAEALELRSYSPARTLPELPLRRCDAALTIGALALAAAALALP